LRRAALLAAALALACEGPHLGFVWDFERMLRQPRDDAYAGAMRTPPEGTVPFAAALDSAPVAPPALSLPLLLEGRARFEITCAACHGLDGRAETPVAAAMALRRPPSLHEPRLVALSPESLEHVIAAGYGLMPSYASLLDAEQRWAVVAYVETLQRSQRVALAALPPPARAEAESALAALPKEAAR
jgi:mono/diheme cytochrome c family protein